MKIGLIDVDSHNYPNVPLMKLSAWHKAHGDDVSWWWGWDEALCGLEATYMDMLSPTYTDGSMRDGCWFCHNQSVDQMRKLRKNYPELWEKLLRIDIDSPVTFKPDGHTVHDFDRRFRLEDEGLLVPGERFKWAEIEQPQIRWF